MRDFDGQTTVYTTDPEEGDSVIREPYSGKLVLTAHSTREQRDPDELTRQLDAWMRANHLSRVEAYWNAIPQDGGDDAGH